MNDREKLIKLIQSAVDGCAEYWAGLIADHLLANGVTFVPDNNFGKWIPVTERLPETDGHLCTCFVWINDLKRGRSFAMEAMTDGIDFGNTINGAVITNLVTHWMPRPEPPKGE